MLLTIIKVLLDIFHYQFIFNFEFKGRLLRGKWHRLSRGTWYLTCNIGPIIASPFNFVNQNESVSSMSMASFRIRLPSVVNHQEFVLVAAWSNNRAVSRANEMFAGVENRSRVLGVRSKQRLASCNSNCIGFVIVTSSWIEQIIVPSGIDNLINNKLGLLTCKPEPISSERLSPNWSWNPWDASSWLNRWIRG